MRAPSPLPEPLGQAFTVSQAAELGVSRRRTRARDLAVPFRGVRVTAEPITQAQWCAAYAPRLRPGQFLCHVSAAVWWGIPLDREFEESREVHVGASAPHSPPRAAGVVGHVLPANTQIRIVRGIPVLSPAQTWTSLGTTLNAHQLVVAGDHLLRRKRPLATLPELRAEVSVPGRPGIRAVRAALADVRAGTDSPKESQLRLAIVRAGLPEPTIGHTVKNEHGDFIATPDLAYVRERIAIEYEGRIHFTDPHLYAQDITRYELLEEAGWLVIRVIAHDLGHRRSILIARVARALAARA